MDLVAKTDQPSPAICGELSIKIDASFDDSDLSLQLKDGKYHCMIDGQLYPLATTLFERFPDKASKLLKIGGSVMAMCYALYNLSFWAYNFMPGTLRFTIGFDDVDKMASIKLNIESGKFHEALWKEWKRIVNEHPKELEHLQKTYQGQIAIGDIKMIDNTQGPTTSNISAAPGSSVAASENVDIIPNEEILMQQLSAAPGSSVAASENVDIIPNEEILMQQLSAAPRIDVAFTGNINNVQGGALMQQLSAALRSYVASGNFNFHERGMMLQQCVRGQTAKGNVRNNNNPTGSTTSTKNETSLSGNNGNNNNS